jgi:hypothetical protein
MPKSTYTGKFPIMHMCRSVSVFGGIAAALLGLLTLYFGFAPDVNPFIILIESLGLPLPLAAVIGCAEVAGLVMVLRLTAESYMAAKTHGVGPMKVVTILMITIDLIGLAGAFAILFMDGPVFPILMTIVGIPTVLIYAIFLLYYFLGFRRRFTKG